MGVKSLAGSSPVLGISIDNNIQFMNKSPRFFIQEINPVGNELIVSDTLMINKIINVLRLKQGDQIEIFNGKGEGYIADI